MLPMSASFFFNSCSASIRSVTSRAMPQMPRTWPEGVLERNLDGVKCVWLSQNGPDHFFVDALSREDQAVGADTDFRTFGAEKVIVGRSFDLLDRSPEHLRHGRVHFDIPRFHVLDEDDVLCALDDRPEKRLGLERAPPEIPRARSHR